MKRSAFTLIELLVVIAIIALLASIAIPVYGNAVEKGRATQCLANLRQVGHGVVLYTNDNDDDFFSKSGTTWPEILNSKYNIAWKAFRSPFDKVTASRPASESGTIPISYGMNSNCFDTNVGKWKSPANVLIGAPAIVPGPAVAFNGVSTQNVEIKAPSGQNKNMGTHSNRTRINTLYGDGRVEQMAWKDYSNSSGDVGSRRWDPTHD